MQIIHHLPLADLADTLRVVMPIIFVVIYGIAHLVGALQEEKKKREKTHPQEEAKKAESKASTTDPDARMMLTANSGFQPASTRSDGAPQFEQKPWR